MTRIATGRDFREVARRRLPHFLFEYYDGAAFDGVTARANEAALGLVQLRQRVLRDVSRCSLNTQYWNEPVALPIVLGPVGLAGLAARRGEVQAARAARTVGIPFTLSSTSLCPLDEVASVMPPWFQLYMVRDRTFVSKMIAWAIEQGCTT
ncbi:MAG TPA: alpha-hydroxy-acid oxidizing protein, partial [Sphingomicrobium sp.]|nr:alpha-hydroxy-acid oxidizing protein [Sphingomicrobium sp.]